jgi:hypothetical protein
MLGDSPVKLATVTNTGATRFRGSQVGKSSSRETTKEKAVPMNPNRNPHLALLVSNYNVSEVQRL